MKNAKRLISLIISLAFAVMLLPTVAMATTTPTPTVTASPALIDDSPVPKVLADTDVPAGLNIGAWTGNYQIGIGAGDLFDPKPSVGKFESDLVLRVFFSGSPANGSDLSGEDYYVIPSSSNRFTVTGGNFAEQDTEVRMYKGCMYIDIVGLKYVNDNDNDFRAKLTDVPNDIFLQIGEATRAIPDPTAEPTGPAATPEPTAVPDPRAPGLIVKSSAIGADSIEAGADFTLSLTVYATASGTENIVDALVSIAPEKGVVVASGSSTQYIGTMKPGSSKTVSFPMRAQSDFTEGVSTVAVTLSGGGETTGSTANATGTTISVPINQPDRFQISKIETPESLMVGEEEVTTITFVNMGKNAVNNLTLDFSGTNCQEATQNQYVGNLAAGTENSVDFNLCPVEAGQLTGFITVTYEGSNGQPVTLKQDISVSVEEAPIMDDGSWSGEDMPADTEPQPAFPLWGILLIVAVIAGAAVAALVILRRRKAKKAAEAAEEDDEDF